MVEKKTIANIITAAIWIGSLIFLIWFCVVQFQRLKHTSVVTTSFSQPESIQYPGIFVCPSSETVFFANATEYPLISVYSGNGAEFQPMSPYDGVTTDNGYSVCPGYVYFPTPDGKIVGCVNFPPAPVYNTSATLMAANVSCSQGNPSAYWYKTSMSAPDPSGGVWTATGAGNHMVIDFESEYIQDPFMMLLYSANTRMQPPTTFAQYAAMFTRTDFLLARIPLMSFSALNIDKIVTDNWPMDTSCNYDGFLSAVEPFTVGTIPPPPFTFRASTVLLGFDILEVVQTCHSPIVGGTDVLGIVGGGIALVLAVTIGFQLLVQKLLGGGERNDTVQGSKYRPLSGDAL